MSNRLRGKPPDVPLLVYDGDCSFCRLWIDRWRTITGDRVAYQPFQDAASRFPEIPLEAFRKSVQLLLPGGELFSAAHAVFRALAFAPGEGWMLWCYESLPGAAAISERIYELVAAHRDFLYKLTRLLWGKDLRPPSYVLTRDLFLRLIGVCYFFAFLSLSTQIIGLIGVNGILPARHYLELIRANLGSAGYERFPTLAWLDGSDGFLRFLTVGGTVLAIPVILGTATAPALALLWSFYLSVVTIGQDFLSFQWDILLLEAGFLVILFTPLGLRPHRRAQARPSRTVLWLLRFLLFRLMFSSGAVKLASGDPTWRNLTALSYHYETQPLPTPLAWYMHLLPLWVHKLSTVLVFGTELFVPFLIFAPRRLRFVGGAALISFQVLIGLTGNYCYFNLLTVALCLVLYDDAVLSRILPRRRSSGGTSDSRSDKNRTIGVRGSDLTAVSGEVVPTTAPRSLVARLALAPIAAVILVAGVLQLAELSTHDLPVAAYRFQGWLEPFHLVNPYGLFAVMTTTRPEIIIEGSNDGRTWQAYEFKDKPGNLRRPPPWVEPFQPRLDWQLWFAALGSYRANPWFVSLMLRLLQASPPVVGLLARDPFPQAPPRYIRALVYEYRFTDWETRRAQGNWWQRELKGLYFPIATLERGP